MPAWPVVGSPSQVHDELVLELDEAALPEVAVVVRECMEGTVKLKVPLNVKINVGPSWGDLKPYDAT